MKKKCIFLKKTFGFLENPDLPRKKNLKIIDKKIQKKILKTRIAVKVSYSVFLEKLELLPKNLLACPHLWEIFIA